MIKIYNIIFILVIGSLSSNLVANTSFEEEDSIRYIKIINKLKVDTSLPTNELMIKVALSFVGTPYVPSTLDKNENEELVVNFRELDCTTFIETCIALTLTLKSGNYTSSNYFEQLKNIRYRAGNIEDYTSRLHYVSDWIRDNTNILFDETKTLGGMLETKNLNFMSTHISAYPPLKNSRELQIKIKDIEAKLNKRGGFYILEKKEIAAESNKIKDGDIIAFATSIVGLDYSHMGIAYHNNGKLTFIHASTRTMKVTIEEQSLFNYCNKSAKCTGISVFRLNE